jgi:hypothetical protein
MWRTRLGEQPAQQGLRPLPSPYNVWAAISRDKGATFSTPLKVSSGDSPAGNSIGDDYSGIVLDREYLYAGWADWRPGTRSGFLGAVSFDEFKFQ